MIGDFLPHALLIGLLLAVLGWRYAHRSKR